MEKGKESKGVTFSPLGEYLIVRKHKKEMTAGGIVLPDITKDRKDKIAVTGKVIAVGPGKYSEMTGVIIPMCVSEGDTVLFTGLAGLELDDSVEDLLGLTKEESEGMLMLRQADIIGKVSHG